MNELRSLNRNVSTMIHSNTPDNSSMHFVNFCRVDSKQSALEVEASFFILNNVMNITMLHTTSTKCYYY